MAVIPFRRTGRWILGALVQEDENGKRRVKVFKGRIKEDGSHEVVYKGQTLRFSMVQRINIPSRRYWTFLKENLDRVVSKYLQEGSEADEEEEEGPTLFDFQ